MIALLLLASQVTQVVVFPDRAQVTRSETVTCAGHAIKVLFPGLPPSADPGSLRVRATLVEVVSLNVVEEPRAQAYAPEVTRLEEEKRRLQAQLAALQDARERAQAQQRLAGQLEETSLGQIGAEMTQPAPDLKAWRLALAQTLQARLSASEKRAELATRERELALRLAEVEQREERLGSSRGRSERRAEVLMACPVGKTTVVDLTYLVGGAGWQPAYDARADEERGVVALSLYANVAQSTGEDWERARIALSTAVPSEDATPPEVTTLRVFADPREPPKKVLVRRDEVQHHAESGASGDKAAQGLAAHEEGLSVRLQVEGPADVPGDGTPARLFVSTAQLQAKFALRTVPRQLPFVFRVADLVSSAPFPLLAGPVDLFHRGAFLGSLPLERVAEGAHFHLTFGLEEGVKVKRTVVEEIARDQGIFKSAQRFRYAYRLSVENHLGRPEQVELAEAIPVAELADLEVGLEDRTSPGFERNAEDGILTWKLKLAAGEKRDLDLAFHVDIPKDYATGF